MKKGGCESAFNTLSQGSLKSQVSKLNHTSSISKPSCTVNNSSTKEVLTKDLSLFSAFDIVSTNCKDEPTETVG